MAAQSKSNRDRSTAFKLVSLGGMIVAVAAISSVTYFYVFNRGSVPPLPRATISSEAARLSNQELVKRAGKTSPDEEEQEIISKMESLHLSETATEEEQALGVDVRRLVADMEAALAKLARRDLNRFILIGDLMAARFHHSLFSLLAKRRSGSADAERDVSAKTMLVRLHGGAFLRNATERGVITADGRISVSSMTPQVLFRYRWRLMGSAEPTGGFSDAEKTALFDFLARFSPPDSVERRLSAVEELGKLDGTYDVILARAIVLFEGGRREAALGELEKAKNKGRSDPSLRHFVRFLQR